MSHRCLAAVIAVAALTPMSAAAQSTNTPEPPQTPWGAPDLQGVWDFRTLTPLERPAEFNGKEVLTAEEAADLEQRDAEIRSQPNPRTLQDECPDGFPICPEAPLAYEFRIWFDRGTTVVGSRRTSLIVDPPEGKIPPLTSAAEEKRAAVWETRRGVAFHAPTPGGFVEDLGPGGLQLRCITGLNSGPPMTPDTYNNNVQLFQTSEYVALLNEMNHNVRMIPLDGRAHVDLPQWTGDSRGHWEGETLVVETTNFLRETSFLLGQSDANLRLVERFTRVSPQTLMYEATIDDPTVWSRPWTFRIPMQLNDQPLYEYACHEGNYGLANILSGARSAEAAAEDVTQGSR